MTDATGKFSSKAEARVWVHQRKKSIRTQIVNLISAMEESGNTEGIAEMQLMLKQINEA